LSSIIIGVTVFTCLFGAALLGILLRIRLPIHHLDAESKDVIRLATAVVGTLSALALGLLIASAKTVFDNNETELRTSAARIVLLDRVMAQYGPETSEARIRLRQLIETRLSQGWGNSASKSALAESFYDSPGIEPIQSELRALKPKDEPQRMLQVRALEVSGYLAEAHWILVESDTEGLPTAFLVILTFWLAWLFATFGLQAPANPTVIGVMGICSMSVAAAVFLVVDMAHPYIGVVHVSDAPLQSALKYIGK
jgi:hypothetical protein